MIRTFVKMFRHSRKSEAAPRDLGLRTSWLGDHGGSMEVDLLNEMSNKKEFEKTTIIITRTEI